MKARTTNTSISVRVAGREVEAPGLIVISVDPTEAIAHDGEIKTRYIVEAFGGPNDWTAFEKCSGREKEIAVHLVVEGERFVLIPDDIEWSIDGEGHFRLIFKVWETGVFPPVELGASHSSGR